ncbi:uncharacterized protein LOC132543837 [Ylistrum balloti]|uniref:uncharacterized protein LOC132543837 n=1 Tax=Ylistrum balloti TaxID=509963 RepID=UPI002905A44F|nr:uncharacterized protein LOC132543837 [Ylistrum balloti]XP_060063336.1 uncharacterized protein LOC132543837 [Ylistrum balloti]
MTDVEKLTSPDTKTRQVIYTPKYDARFPNQNSNKMCWQYYVDYHRCVRKMGEEYDGCMYFKQAYTSLCPSDWVERWDEQQEKGFFACRIMDK